MPIDFHAAANRRTYAGRDADPGWQAAMRAIVDPTGCAVIDVGCGGGTYARAWLDLGAASVTGVDFSAQMLSAAREDAAGRAGLRFVRGDAAATGLPAASADVVFSRAVIHHVADLGAVMAEAARLLRPGGTLVVQDRTPQDVEQPGSADHPRGLVLERFPRLLDVERARRPDGERVLAAIAAGGLRDGRATSLWELRRRHADREDLLAELRARTGRSLLHELDDAELEELVAHLRDALPEGPVDEHDRWTLWSARA